MKTARSPCRERKRTDVRINDPLALFNFDFSPGLTEEKGCESHSQSHLRFSNPDPGCGLSTYVDYVPRCLSESIIVQACLRGVGFGDSSYENPTPRLLQREETICFPTLPITPHIIRGRRRPPPPPQNNPLSVAANGGRTNRRPGRILWGSSKLGTF